VGTRIFAYFMGDNNVRTRRFTICGIYCTNLKHFDESICFADLYTVVKLNGWEPDQASGAELSVSDFEHSYDVNLRLIDQVNHTEDQYGSTYSSLTIQESYPSIFAWLNLLDLDVWIILALMVAVAGFTMISGLLIIIIERTGMIGTLKALGANNRSIRHTFLWFAVFIIAKGMAIGNLLGIGLCVLQRFTGLIHLDAETYYVDVVPVELNIPAIIAINVATLAISVIVLIAPSFLISHIHPAKTMKFE
jgi:lipoprotein-releasing system permease protein